MSGARSSHHLGVLGLNGLTAYFGLLDVVLPRMNDHGRIVCCGMLAQYDTDAALPGPRTVPGLLVSRRLRMEGFVVLDHAERRVDAVERLRAWVERGELVVLEEIVDGLDAAPAAFVDLLAGGNVGKRLVRVSH